MLTATKVAANRHNARSSTGPRTPEGKDASRLNALRHGLLCQPALLPDEAAEEFMAPLERLRVDLQPQGQLEEFLVERVATCAWRLRRVLAVEAGVFSARRFDPIPVAGALRYDGGRGTTFMCHSADSDVFSKLSRYEAAIERGLYRALHELQRVQARRKGETSPLPIAVDVDLNGTRVAGG